MKKYQTPELQFNELSEKDVITSSPGTEMPRYDENDGIWDMEITN